MSDYTNYDDNQLRREPCVRLDPPCGKRVSRPDQCHGEGCPLERFAACWRRVVGNSDEVSE
jgi:hypothetical protein